ncbi:MAG TPA: hypothetical protein VEZ90_04500 [Blastocatellia bacterium]|nr:hypothetical protein [Blastocatellia bacterium]
MSRPDRLRRKISLAFSILGVSTILVTLTIGSTAVQAQSPVATGPYSVSVFGSSVPGSYTEPESIAFAGSVYVAYGNGILVE